MNKITEMALSAFLKKGLLYEANELDTEIEIPLLDLGVDIKGVSKIKINIKCKDMKLTIQKD